MIELQGNHERYFKQQYDTINSYVIPFIEKVKPIQKGMKFLEVGSGYGGICKAFADAGCKVTGIELLDYVSDISKDFLKEDISKDNIRIINQNVYEMNDDEKYDIILLKDTIEHIHDQAKFMKHIVRFLKEDGVFFFGFPPWCMPFGGHQQSLDSKVLDKIPYYHLLPNFIYRGLMKMFGEHPIRIRDAMEVKETRISINRFERIVKSSGLKIAERKFFFINPSYQYKFGMKVKEQNKIIASIPWLRDFVTTTCYYVLKKS